MDLRPMGQDRLYMTVPSTTQYDLTPSTRFGVQGTPQYNPPDEIKEVDPSANNIPNERKSRRRKGNR